MKKSGAVIDPERVNYIKTQDRAQCIKDHWDDLDSANQFLHLWLSGMIEHLTSIPMWVDAYGRGAHSIMSFMRIVTNWVAAPSAKDIDIIDYIEMRVRE